MSKVKFLIKLHIPHEKSGLTAYAVAKALNLNKNTVGKYTKGMVEAERIENHVIELANFYGVDWRDPAVIEEFEEDEEDTKPVQPISQDDPQAMLA